MVCAMSTVAAGAAVKDPSAMILREADLPGATYEAEAGLDDYLRKPLKAAGLSGKAAQYLGVTYSQRRGIAEGRRRRPHGCERSRGTEGLHDHEEGPRCLPALDRGLDDGVVAVLRQPAGARVNPPGKEN